MIPVNGPHATVKCPGCQHETQLESDFSWRQLLNLKSPAVDIFTFSTTKQPHDATVQGKWDKVDLASTRSFPKCACGRRFDATELDDALIAEKKEVACWACSLPMALEMPPEHLLAEFRAVRTLLGTSPSTESTSTWWIVFDRTQLAR